MLDCEELFAEFNIAIVKVIPTVVYDIHQIFKVTLVCLLNAKMFLSKGMIT